MPELPEVETVVRELVDIENKKIKKVQVFNVSSVEMQAKAFVKKLVGKKVLKVGRRGKYVLLYLVDDDIVTVHFRMTGKLVFHLENRDLNYLRVQFDFSDGAHLYFVDIRKFGRIKFWNSNEDILPGLGIEPFNPQQILRALKQFSSKREIKKVLLDQSLLAGIGNIYADEVLFLSGIHPLTPFDQLEEIHMKELSKQIPRVLNKAINRMGTTLSDYRTTKNIGGENQNYLKVYGQKDRPCTKCKRKIEKVVIGGRSSHFCPNCQPF